MEWTVKFINDHSKREIRVCEFVFRIWNFDYLNLREIYYRTPFRCVRIWTLIQLNWPEWILHISPNAWRHKLARHPYHWKTKRIVNNCSLSLSFGNPRDPQITYLHCSMPITNCGNVVGIFLSSGTYLWNVELKQSMSWSFLSVKHSGPFSAMNSAIWSPSL